MHGDQSALIREGRTDLPAGENGTAPHFLLQGGLVYTVCVCVCVCVFVSVRERERERAFSSCRCAIDKAEEKGCVLFTRVLPVSTLSLERKTLPMGRMKFIHTV